ncbi:MAG: class I SAM-dependent methyltransferase [Candidatus Omnitrophica bacterium]|nr:class I SAM-dependent methyltransferase [Candidatus Omnitrophota bacterium]
MWKLYGGSGLQPKHILYYLKKRAARNAALKIMPKNAVCAEIGVLTGDFSAQILRITKPDKLFLIDPWKYGGPDEKAVFSHSGLSQTDLDCWHSSVHHRFKAELEADKVEIMRVRSEDAAQSFDDRFFDWIYIDGDHSYEGVLKDLKLYLPKIKQNGCMVLDDYNRKSKWQSGVRQAADEFSAEHPYISRKYYFNQLILQIGT